MPDGSKSRAGIHAPFPLSRFPLACFADVGNDRALGVTQIAPPRIASPAIDIAPPASRETRR